MFDSSLLILTGVLPVTAQDPTLTPSFVWPDEHTPPPPPRLSIDDAQSIYWPDDLKLPPPPPRLTIHDAQASVWPDDLTLPPPPPN